MVTLVVALCALYDVCEIDLLGRWWGESEDSSADMGIVRARLRSKSSASCSVPEKDRRRYCELLTEVVAQGGGDSTARLPLKKALALLSALS